MSTSHQDPAYDVIVVGGGTAGSVLASRLSEDSKLTVLVIEAGLNRNNDSGVKAPGASAALIGNPAYDWNLKSSEQIGLNGRSINQPRGKLVGGSSAINSHCLAYPSREYHDAWKQFGASGWSWEAIAPYYRKFQSVSLPDQETHNRLHLDYVDSQHIPTTGPIKASYPVHTTELQKAWIDTYRALACAVDSDPIDGRATGGLTLTNAIDTHRRERSHAGTAYLQYALDRANLNIVTNATVDMVTFDTNHKDGLIATGVRYAKDGQEHLVRACREVVICAGAFQSPQILELSGIGSKSVLESHGIECLLNNPHVGENLQDHLNIGPSIEVKDGVKTNDEMGRDKSLVEAARKAYDEDQSGPFSRGSVYSFAYQPLSLLSTPDETASLEAILTSSNASSASPPTASLRGQYEFISQNLLTGPSATVFFTTHQRHADAPTLAAARAASDPGNFITVLAMLSHPYSRGSVHIGSASAHDHPVIDPAYLTHPLDVEVLMRHLRGIDRLVEQEPLASYLKPNGTRLPRSFPSPVGHMAPADIDTMIRRCVATNYHPAGTCAIADTIELGGVVDKDLRVHGTHNLRVCDASVLPLIPRGNILSTVYAVAERAADLMKNSLYEAKRAEGPQ